MKVKIRYFGRFATTLGKFSEEMEIPDNTNVSELLEILKGKYPVLKNEVIEVSIDGKYAKENEKVKEEVSIYPPISGG